MAITGLSKLENTDYISEKDPCKTEAEGATVFVLGALDKETLGALRDSMQTLEMSEGKNRVVMNTSAVFVKACRVGLRGWRNFKDADGKDIPFKTEDDYLFGKSCKLLTQETVGKFPMDLLMELGQAIVEKNSKLDSKLLKN